MQILKKIDMFHEIYNKHLQNAREFSAHMAPLRPPGGQFVEELLDVLHFRHGGSWQSRFFSAAVQLWQIHWEKNWELIYPKVYHVHAPKQQLGV